MKINKGLRAKIGLLERGFTVKVYTEQTYNKLVEWISRHTNHSVENVAPYHKVVKAGELSVALILQPKIGLITVTDYKNNKSS